MININWDNLIDKNRVDLLIYQVPPFENKSKIIATE